MSCGSCRSQARTLVQTALRTRHGKPLTSSSSSRTAATSRSFTAQSNSPPASATTTASIIPSRLLPTSAAPRSFSTTSSKKLFGMGGSHERAYNVIGATEMLFKICTKKADYMISKNSRSNDTVEKLEDGEEVGVALYEGNEWHNFFQLRPTFSSWSHVTMLHLYLLNARIRCFDRDIYRNWQHQLIDHFFFECEKKMHIDHNITASALRQRYLKDVFVQWRGLIIAYDEGVYKSDAILASAVWRNLYKGDPDVDPRCLAAVVGWMRSTLKSLEGVRDQDFGLMAAEIMDKEVSPFWSRLEGPFRDGPKQQHEQQQEQKEERKAAPANPSAENVEGTPVQA